MTVIASEDLAVSYHTLQRFEHSTAAAATGAAAAAAATVAAAAAVTKFAQISRKF